MGVGVAEAGPGVNLRYAQSPPAGGLVALPRSVRTTAALAEGSGQGMDGLGAIVPRVLKEFVIPLIGGVAYGAIVGSAKQSPLDGASAGGVAFLCLFVVLGVILRASKPARDERPAMTVDPRPLPEPKTVEIKAETVTAIPAPPPVETRVEAPVERHEEFTSIRRGMEELKEQGALPPPDAEKPESGQKMLFRNLYRSSPSRAPVEALAPRQLLELKMPYQAVLNAAVNFEREVRRKANLPSEKTISLTELFEQPQFDLSDDQRKQLDVLRRMRNSIIHGFEAFVDPVEAEELVSAFDRAVSWFGPAKNEPKPEPKAKSSDG